MIDINELRKLTQAATLGGWYVERGNYIYGCKEVTDGEEKWHPVIACTDDDEVNVNFEANAAFIAAVNPAAVSELIDRLEAAEKDIALKERIIDSLGSELNAVAHERDELRARIERMEKQEPVAAQHRFRHPQKTMPDWSDWWLCDVAKRPAWTIDSQGYEVEYRQLYALPGAQPAQRAPDVWLPVPEKHPTFDPVDLQLSDGSVLCGCVPQSDGDYWWEGPSGEVFIDPKYANVTHWRLAAAPEAKP